MDHNPNIDIWVRPDRLFSDRKLVSGVALEIQKGRVAQIVPADTVPEGSPTIDFKGTISPGFVDLQVNGGGGALVNTHTTKDGIWRIARAHRSFGTVGILPTVITDDRHVLPKAVDAVLGAFGEQGIYGIHIEGPHISTVRKGTHKTDFIRPLDDDTLGEIRKLRDAGIPTMMTVAPEVVTPQEITRLVDMGVVVSIGHSAANNEQTKAAFGAGANCVTHLFNAMSPIAGREPGVTGAAINSDAFVGIICDGIHVADEMVGLAIRARPNPDRMFIVSDAMPTVGGPPSFDLYGKQIHLDGNRLVNAEGSLAGAHTTQASGVQRLVANVGISLEEALKMAISVPCDVMGLDLEQVSGRPIADLVCLGEDAGFLGSLSSILENQSLRTQA